MILGRKIAQNVIFLIRRSQEGQRSNSISLSEFNELLPKERNSGRSLPQIFGHTVNKQRLSLIIKQYDNLSF